MKREQLLWLLTATAGAAPLLEYEQGSVFDYPGLKFGVDRKFRITQFNDMHLGDIYRPGSDEKTIGVMKTVLDSEPNTNLVVLNGDLTSCEFVAPGAANGLVDKIIQPLIDRNMPFTATFGNHDMSKTCSTRKMSEHIWDTANKNGRQLTWTTNSVQGQYNKVGTSNYYIPIYSSAGGGNPHLVLMLWFFDSKGGKDYTVDDMQVDDFVDPKVVAWFQLTRDAINKDHGKAIPGLAFVHIPPHVTRAFQEGGGLTSTTEPGLNEEAIGHQSNPCDANDDCTWNRDDVPFMQAMVETEGMMAVFSGHDHGIDWCMPWSANKPVPGDDPEPGNSINLCFGRHTGYGGYSDWMRGGRQIVLDEDKLGENILETWNRLEDGSISGKVTLNSTYGIDQYPEVEDKKTSGAGAVVVDSDANATMSGESGVPTKSKLLVTSTSAETTWTETNTAKPTLQPTVNPIAKPTSHEPSTTTKPSARTVAQSAGSFSSPDFLVSFIHLLAAWSLGRLTFL